MRTDTISASNFADIMGVSKATLLKWERNGKFVPHDDGNGHKYFLTKDLLSVPQIKEMVNSAWNEEMRTRPLRDYTSIELFAGAGGLALGMSMAGIHHLMLNEVNHDACETLRRNRPAWSAGMSNSRLSPSTEGVREPPQQTP